MSFGAILPAIAGAASPVGVAAGGGALSALGSFVGMQGERRAAGFQAVVAQRNAALAEENALREAEAGQIEGRDAGILAGEEIGQIMAAQGASGLTVGIGSGQNRLLTARSLALRDQARLRQDTDSRVAGRRQEAADFRSEAAMAKARKRQALLSGMIGMGSSLIGGAESVNRIRMGM